jgi:hypothetical protein
MAVPTTIPVTITPEAAARAAELGIQADIERIIEHARNTVPGLRSLEVSIRECYDSYEETGILIHGGRDVSYRPDDPTERQWDKWVISTFPPQVLEHFTVLFSYGAGHAG